MYPVLVAFELLKERDLSAGTSVILGANRGGTRIGRQYEEGHNAAASVLDSSHFTHSANEASSETQGQIVGARGKAKRAEKYGTKKSKERREEPLGTMGAFHLGKKAGNFRGSKSGISDW